MARHEAGDHSDLDLLVVMDTDLKGTKRAAAIHKRTVDLMMPLDVFVLTPSEFEANRDNKFSFASEIVRTGTVVYDGRGRSSVRSIRHNIEEPSGTGCTSVSTQP